MSEPVITRPVTIVVLSKFKEVLRPFIETSDKYEPTTNQVVVVDSNTDIEPTFLADCMTRAVQPIFTVDPFEMAKNGNIGLKAVPLDNDILYCGDDIRFVQKDTVKKLQQIAYGDPAVGILSPRLIGRGSTAQVNPPDGMSDVRPIEMWFPCVYIKREVLDKVGFLDEQFSNFGSDDLDFCIRTKIAGFRLCVTSEVAVKHEASEEGGPTTFCKTLGTDEWLRQQAFALEKLRRKYNVSHQTLSHFLASGEISLLENKMAAISDTGFAVPKDKAEEYLKTRSIYLATPAYGGWLSVNYTNSLISLINKCRDLGIRFGSSFLYNESLITRARNQMVADYLKTDYTDFFFIDADIGFNADDVISLLLHNEGVVGSPCARKNLRLDRIVQAVKKNGREYTIAELEDLIGEIVLNFDPENPPAKFSIGEMLEVKDAGTGLMRVRREVFEKFREFYPDRYYLSMNGDGGAPQPEQIYMFFQSRIDEESGKYNPGNIPNYIPEDFAFSRDCRKAGIKVYIAPWIKTTHMGSYFFKGDLKAIALAGGALR